MLNKKVLAVAVIGGLFAAGNAAAVELKSASSAGTQGYSDRYSKAPLYFAEEIKITNPSQGLQLTTAGDGIQWQIGYNFSAGEVRYVRLEAPAGVKFVGATPTLKVWGVTNQAAIDAANTANAGLTCTGANPDANCTPVPAAINGMIPVSDAAIGAVNGAGTNVVYFSVTAGASGIPAGAVIDFGTNLKISSTASSVVVTASLYDQPSQAQNGGENGNIVAASATGTVLAFGKSYELVANTNTSVADVEAPELPFSLFEYGADETEIGELSLQRKEHPTLGYPKKADGTAIQLTDLFATGTAVVIDGDFTAVADEEGFAAGTLSRDNVLWDGAPTYTLTASKATFRTTAGISGNLFFRTAGEIAIPASEYVASLVPVATQNYNVSPITGVKVGSIVRNGTTLQAPLVQIPGGWLARLALTNTGSMARPFSISVMTEEGATFEIDAAKLAGEIPANGTKVVELSTADLAEASGKRGTIEVTVSGPYGQIEGLYQIVNPNNGLLSNHVLVKKGAN